MDNKYHNNYYHSVIKKNAKITECVNCGKDISKLLKRRICNKCIKNRIHGARGEYKCRIIVQPSNKAPTYGITIPDEIIIKYNLYDKKFKIRVSPKGKFILYSQVD